MNMVQAVNFLHAAMPIRKWMGRLCRYRFVLGAMFLMGFSSIASSITGGLKTNLPNGCAIYNQSSGSTLIIYRSDGRCKNGLADGFWSYGAEIGQQRLYVHRYVVDGQLSGLNFVIRPDRAFIMVREPNTDTNFVKLLERNSSPAEAERFLASIDEANAVARKLGKPAGDAAKMKSIVRKWKQGDDSILDQWISGPGTFPTAAAATMDSGGADDPKTVGRGMRGG